MKKIKIKEKDIVKAVVWSVWFFISGIVGGGIGVYVGNFWIGWLSAVGITFGGWAVTKVVEVI